VVIQEITAIKLEPPESYFFPQLALIQSLAKAEKYASFTMLPWGSKCTIPWSVGMRAICSALFGMGSIVQITWADSAEPSSLVISGLSTILNEHPSGEGVQFGDDVSTPGSASWAVRTRTPHS
jgi:hypothetical protein